MRETALLFFLLDLLFLNFGVKFLVNLVPANIRRAAFSANLKAKVVSTLAKDAVLRINLTIDGTPISSKTHTHPSHSQTSRLLSSSLSLGVPVPRTTQCVDFSSFVFSLSSHRHSYTGLCKVLLFFKPEIKPQNEGRQNSSFKWLTTLLHT
jgi:hypothetical protein